MSKGSRQRPTNKQAFDNNFDAIFGKNKDVSRKQSNSKSGTRTDRRSDPKGTILKTRASNHDPRTLNI